MPAHGSAAKHMFYYLLSLVSLGFFGVGLGQILFQVINASFPETTYAYDSAYTSEVLRFGMASVMVAGPIYGIITFLINRDLRRGTLDRDSAVRKWLTYLILLASVLTVMGFLIGFIVSFLGGELTVKFALKVLSAILIASLFFAYYFFDIRREAFQASSVLKGLGITAILVSLVILVAGFFVLDPPSKVRSLREDATRVEHLSQISWQVEEYYRQENRLPETLDALEGRLQPYFFNDPVTDIPLEYRVLGELSYELCATFENSNRVESNLYPKKDPYPYHDQGWIHDEGRQCFEMKIVVPPGPGEIKGGVPVPVR